MRFLYLNQQPQGKSTRNELTEKFSNRCKHRGIKPTGGNKIVILFILLFIGGFSQASNNLEFKKGVLDIRGYDLNELKEIAFTGEWEFYWNKLLESSDFQQPNNDSVLYVRVPSVWKSFKIDNVKLPAQGAVTYRAIILKDTSQINFAFKLGSIGTAFKLFIDGVEHAKAGNVSINKRDAVPNYMSGVVNFSSKSDSIEIIFQVSNYHYSKGGLWNNFLKIGGANQILKSWNREIQFSILLIGIMLIIAFYNLSLYYLNRSFKYTLFFSLFCLIIAIRTLLVDEIFLLDMFPSFNWYALIKMEYLTLTLGNIAFVLFINSFFNDKKTKKLLSVIVISSIIFSLFIVLTLPTIFTKYLIVYQIAILLALTYTSIIVVRALRQKSMSAVIMSIGFFILMISVVNDILYTNKAINTMYLSSFGFVIFIISQAYMMSKHLSSLFNETKNLAQKLKATNLNLETIVEERTFKVLEQNILLKNQQDEILSKNSELKQHNIDIKQQRDNFKKQHKIVNEQKKQITNSIEYAGKIQSAVLETDNKIDKVAPDNFIIFHPKDIVSGDFYWFKELEFNGKKIKIIAVVDCTGHGVPGAFMSILGTLLLNKIASELKNSPQASDILNIMRYDVKNLLYKQSGEESLKDGMDMSLAILDYDTMKMQFAGAHNQIYLIRNNNNSVSKEIEEYKGDNMPIGIYMKEKDSFTNYIIDINKGDMCYLFSDGYYDQFGGKNGKRFTKKIFKEILLSGAHLTMSKQRLGLEKELLEWRGNYEQIDDITVVGIRI